MHYLKHISSILTANYSNATHFFQKKDRNLSKLFLSMVVIILLSLVMLSCQKEAEPPAPAAPTSIVDSAISADGVPISYQVQGDGSPALVFIHGWCCDRSYWDAQVEHFSKNHKVVAIDLAGHGDSGIERAHWTTAAFGNDVAAVIEKLGLDQVVLIGHSMGGFVMIEAAHQMPDRIIGLVGIDTLTDLEDRWTQEQFDEFIAAFKSNFTKATDKFVRTMFPPSADPDLVEQIAADMSSAPSEVGVGAMEGMFAYFNNDMEKALQEIQIPVVCINSDLWETNVEANKKYIASYELLLMPGLGHFIMMEDPETFNQLLTEAVEKFKAEEVSE